ncbi:MAG: hypothetical protein EBZ48_13370 [Proteobacteria bacterium]|nr:hypothetical protein [Pseudomonadota bacterium]
MDHFNVSDDYPASEFFDWHGRLTQSCKAGRDQFLKDKGIQLTDMYTVNEFVELTKDAYGGDTIKALAKAMRED